MNAWSRKEIYYAWVPCQLVQLVLTFKFATRSLIHGRGISDQERIDDLYYQLGPTPRLCVEYLSVPHILAAYQADLQLALGDMTLEQLEQLNIDASFLTLDAISDKICLIIREDREDMAGPWIVKSMTPVIQSKLACQFRKVERDDQIRFYEQLSSVSSSRGLAGIAFEAAAQARLQKGLDLDLLPMVQLPSTREDSLPRWYSSHVLLRDQTLETRRQQALGEGHRIQVQPSQIVEYTDDGPSSMVPGALYVPKINNFFLFAEFYSSPEHRSISTPIL
jgi:hypothetical protein